ncbi:MAG: hypothetical protein NTZ70_05955 [Methylococcales bacterium]|nr:hypothetical protein [Methylococcales bacterium]
MLIRIALWLFLLCLPFFIVAKALLIFTLFVIASVAMKGALFLMLAGFSLFILAGGIFIFRQLWCIFQQYFSTEQCFQRHMLFVKNQKTNRQRLLYFQRLQLNYFKERQRKKILEKNNRQQIKVLSNAITHELKQIKAQISHEIFSKLELENYRYRLQQNETALLELHNKIATIAGKYKC